MLRVPESMGGPLEAFVVALFSGEMCDPEVLARALQSLALAALPDAQAARRLRQQYRLMRDHELRESAGRSTSG